jgi:pilus assembly protein CpaB
MRQKLLLVVAVFFGLLAFFLSYQQMSQMKKRIMGETVSLTVITLNGDKMEGETIAAGDLVQKEIRRYPKDVSNNDVLWNRKNDVIGAKLGRSINKDEILRYSDLATTGGRHHGGLASVIVPGERAISIAVDSTSSVTGLIQPDDNVDIIGTFRFPEMKGDQALDTITLTLLQKVKVLATGTAMKDAVAAPGQRAQKGYSTITLALSPKEVEMIIFASQKGRLSLSLRNTEDTGFVDIKDLQSVNFRLLEKDLPQYNQERQRRTMGGRR